MSDNLRAFRRWRSKAGYILIPGRLTWWRSTGGRWGWTRDAYGPVYRVGHLSYYPAAVTEESPSSRKGHT